MPRDWNVTYTSVNNPVWANAEKEIIDCIVKFDHMPSEVTFTASPNDVEAHGRDIFNRCVNGEFGPVSEFVPITEEISPPTGLYIPPAGWPDIELFLADANKENANGTDRGCVLVWAAMIDELLRRLIGSFLVEANAKADNEVFSHNGPIGSFSNRTNLSYRLGLLTLDERNTIHKIRDVRNEFAHRFGISLGSESLVARCQNLYDLTCNDGIKLPPRLLFTAACCRIAIIISNRISHAKKLQRVELIDPVPIHLR